MHPACLLQLETTGGVFARVLTPFASGQVWGVLEEPTTRRPGGGASRPGQKDRFFQNCWGWGMGQFQGLLLLTLGSLFFVLLCVFVRGFPFLCEHFLSPLPLSLDPRRKPGEGGDKLGAEIKQIIYSLYIFGRIINSSTLRFPF